MNLQERRLYSRIWACVLLVALALTLTAVPVQAAPSATATIIVNRAPVWAGPGQGFWWLGFLVRDEVVPVLGISADHQWWQVSTRFGVAWLWYLDVTTSTDAVPVVDPGPIGKITGGRVVVRGGPGIGAQAVGAASNGMQFYVIGMRPDGSWIQIRYRFGIGWVATSLTSLAGNTALVNVPAIAGPHAIVNTGALNVRTGPGFGFASLGVLSGGTVVPIIGRNQDGSWLQVRTPLGDGWVNIIYVVTKDYFGSAPVTESQAAGAKTAATFVVLTGTVNVRSGPNVAFPSLFTVNAGMKLNILGQSHDRFWWFVEAPAGKGWINKQLGQAIGSVGTVPVID
jgi:uncharacterized protein YraI